MLISSVDELHAYATELVSKNYTHIFLTGELGAGKTTFTQGYAKALGIDPVQVQSPTYTYLHIYDEKLLHIDMYRITDKAQAIAIELPQLIETYPYVIIERPKFTDMYSDYTWYNLDIMKISDTDRTLAFSLA